MNILIEKLKNIVKERRESGTHENALINVIKEELQYAILDFVYNHRSYSNLIMYGGTLLRIGYGLPRMSEDLDFQTGKKINFEGLKRDLISYFRDTFDIDIKIKLQTERLAGTDIITINFPDLLHKVEIKGHGMPTVLKIRFDINYFPGAFDFATESISIAKGSFVFSIRTYRISTLMASKITAVLLRTKRGIGREISACKPRDIYDLIWYMEKKIMPDIKYLNTMFERSDREIRFKNSLEVFDTLKKRVTNLDDKLFKFDLAPFFYNPAQYDSWHQNWKQKFAILMDSYEIYKIKRLSNRKPDLIEVYIGVDFSSSNRFIHFSFGTQEPAVKKVVFTCILSEYWYRFNDLKISNDHRRKEIENRIKGSSKKITSLDYAYVGLFYTKIENYLKSNDDMLPQPEIKTKIIRATGDNLNMKTQIFLDRRLLEKEKFENLL